MPGIDFGGHINTERCFLHTMQSMYTSRNLQDLKNKRGTSNTKSTPVIMGTVKANYEFEALVRSSRFVHFVPKKKELPI